MKLRVALALALPLAMFCGSSQAQDDSPFCESLDKMTSAKFQESMQNFALTTTQDVTIGYTAEFFKECSVRSPNPDNVKALCKNYHTTIDGPEKTKESVIGQFSLYTEMAASCGVQFDAVEERTPSNTRYCLAAKGHYTPEKEPVEVLYEGCSDDGEHWVRFIVSWN